MGDIEFKGDSPFDLTLQGRATATFSGGSVVVTLPVSAVGSSLPKVVELRVMMSIESVEHLRDQFPGAIEMANRNLWSGR
jgi:hypothetical protein